MAAAWWVVLPIDFNSLYEVHLFVVIPVLLSILAILWIPGSWGRGWGAAGLLVSGLLMRNELVPCGSPVLSALRRWEYRRFRRKEAAPRALAHTPSRWPPLSW